VVPYRGEERYWRHLKVMGEVGQIVPLKFTIRDQNLLEKAVQHSDIGTIEIILHFLLSLVVNCIGSPYSTRNYSLEEANVESAKNIALVLMY
jgi:NADH dehydrogenase (ubiquinone) 1 alpha subcomplex subunit 9